MSRNRSWGISAKGKHYEPGELPGTFVYVVTPGYLNAIGMRLVKGRDMTWEDNDPKQAVVIINETVARYLWPNEDPIDRIAVIAGNDARVIGVIADVRETSAEAKSGWQMYVSTAAPQFGSADSQLVIRSSLPAETLQPSVLAALRQINPGQPAADLKPIQLLVDHASSPRRFFVYLVGIFAALGLILAALGIYGVISYSVTQRTQEIGIRMALGATQRAVQLGVIWTTLQLALIGVAIGTVASLGASRADRFAPLRHHSNRPHHLRRYGGRAGSHRPARRLHPRPTSLPNQPHGRAPQQLDDFRLHCRGSHLQGFRPPAIR